MSSSACMIVCGCVFGILMAFTVFESCLGGTRCHLWHLPVLHQCSIVNLPCVMILAGGCISRICRICYLTPMFVGAGASGGSGGTRSKLREAMKEKGMHRSAALMGSEDNEDNDENDENDEDSDEKSSDTPASSSKRRNRGPYKHEITAESTRQLLTTDQVSAFSALGYQDITPVGEGRGGVLKLVLETGHVGVGPPEEGCPCYIQHVGYLLQEDGVTPGMCLLLIVMVLF